MEKRKIEQSLSYTKIETNKKTPSIIAQIKGVGSRKYSIHFVKKGY